LPPIYSPIKNKKKFLLDECNQIKCKNLRKRFGFVNASEIAKPGTADCILLKKATKRKLVVITRDYKFALQTILEGHQIVFENQDGTRILVPKNKIEVIDSDCRIKYSDEITFHLIENDEVIRA